MPTSTSKTEANIYIRIDGVKDVLCNSLGDDERKWFTTINLMKKTIIFGFEWSQIASVYTFAITCLDRFEKVANSNFNPTDLKLYQAVMWYIHLHIWNSLC